MKKCTKCLLEKNYVDFYKDKQKKDGLYSSCKECQNNYYLENKNIINKRSSLYSKNWYKENKEKILNYQKEKRKEKKEVILIYQKKYYLENKEKIKERTKNWYQENKEKITIKRKIWEKNNKEKIALRKKIYNKENNDKRAKYRRIYEKNKIENDAIFKFSKRLRHNIRDSFKRGKNQFRKNASTQQILGCTIKEFIVYIQSKFKKGMTLENHGEWHLDHIIPLATATTEEEVKELCHYTNYQPLWAEDNLSKSDKIIEQQLKLL
jgi:hypothetical protein